MDAALNSAISRLSPAEKLQLVEEVWNDLAKSEDLLPIPVWHEQILAEDQARFLANPTEGAPWPEVKARLLRKP